jgi:hypothetical protein
MSNRVRFLFPLLAIISFMNMNISQAQSIFSNPIDGQTNSISALTAGQTVNSNLTVSGLSIGPGNLSSTANNSYRANSWESSAIDLNDYFNWTLTPNAGFNLNLGSIQYDGQRTGNGPTLFALRSSLDNFATNIGTATAADTTISLTATEYQNITSAISFRLYAWGAAGSNEGFAIQDFNFSGSLTPVPEPTTILGVGAVIGLSFGAIRKRFRRI